VRCFDRLADARAAGAVDGLVRHRDIRAMKLPSSTAASAARQQGRGKIVVLTWRSNARAFAS
jgi:hypothetical protein